MSGIQKKPKVGAKKKEFLWKKIYFRKYMGKYVPKRFKSKKQNMCSNN